MTSRGQCVREMNSSQRLPGISCAVRHVFQEFQRVQQDIQQVENNGRKETKAQADAIEDAFEKFRLWTGNLGALQDPSDTRSLEFRLRNAQAVRRRVGELLEELLELLQNGMCWL